MFTYEQPIDKASFSKRLSFESSLHFYQKSVADKADWWLSEVGMGSDCRWAQNARNVLKLDCSDGCTALKFTHTK